MSHRYYAALSVDKFYQHLIANKIILRKRDIEAIVNEVKEEFPKESNIVHIQRSYEKVQELYDKVYAIRQAKAAYTGDWNGIDQRKTTA